MIDKTKRSTERWVNLHKNKKYLGVHLIAEFWSVKSIDSKKEFEKVLRDAVKAAKSTPLELVVHKFSPHGITGVILLTESHIAIHTWPELNYVAIDVFTCGDWTKPHRALEYLKKQFKPKKVDIRELKRGRKK